MSPFTVSFSGSNTIVCLLLLYFCRAQTPQYVSLYCLLLGFKHHCMSPITLSLSVGFKHFCMSLLTVSVGSNTTVCLPLLSLSVQTPLYVSHYSLCRFKHHCMSPITLHVSSNTTLCLPLCLPVSSNTTVCLP